jgi:hypothetical protein
MMSRKLRVRRIVESIPLAADVLETRALLSGATAAAHAAVHHAETLASAVASPSALQPPGFKSSSSAAGVQIGAGPVQQIQFKFSISSFHVALDAKVTAHASANFTLGGSHFHLKLTVLGTVHTVSTVGGSTLIHIHPTGGSFLFKQSGPSGHVSATAFPNGNEPLIVVNNPSLAFDALEVTDTFPSTAAGGLANQPIKFTLSLG